MLLMVEKEVEVVFSSVAGSRQRSFWLNEQLRQDNGIDNDMVMLLLYEKFSHQQRNDVVAEMYDVLEKLTFWNIGNTFINGIKANISTWILKLI